MAETIPPEMGKGPMMEQAQEIWKMLDNMAASNPEGYKKFIETQMKEAKESMKPPDPHMCIKTNILVNRKYFY